MLIGQWLSFGIGGADKAAYYLVKGLLESNIEVKVFYNKQSFPKLSSQWDRGTQMLSRYEQCKALGVPMFEINNLLDLNNHNLKILNTHRGGDDFWAIPGFEQTDFNFRIIETNFHGHTGTKADLRIFPSHEMIRTVGITCPHYIIPNPIMCKASENNLRTQLGLDNKFVFGRISRPCKEIYSSTCLRAFKLIENDDVYFLYIAPCEFAREDAKRLRIKNITFVDQTIDEIRISELYNTFDVLCHDNNLGETFGNTVAEAMIHGKPVVSRLGSNWPQAQKEVIGEYADTYVCENNINQYSELMLKLMANEQEYVEYSKYVKNRADKLYDYRTVTRRYINIYDKFK
jgi:glycosyltransferase involved in cell wall biosynthesis